MAQCINCGKKISGKGLTLCDQCAPRPACSVCGTPLPEFEITHGVTICESCDNPPDNESILLDALEESAREINQLKARLADCIGSYAESGYYHYGQAARDAIRKVTGA